MVRGYRNFQILSGPKGEKKFVAGRETKAGSFLSMGLYRE